MYGICLPHLHLPKIILHVFTWYHVRPLYSILYDSTGKNTLLNKLNQPFQDIENRINNYILNSGKYIYSSYATIIPQSSRRGLQNQVDRLVRDGP